MAMDEETKKKLLYGGGAIASIVALVYIFKNKSSGGQSVSVPTRSGGTGGGSNASPQTEAARINAATQLAIAQGVQDIEKQKIAAQYGIIAGQTQGAVDVAKINANAAMAKAAIGGGALAPGGAATTATKGLFETLQDLVDKAFGNRWQGTESGSVNPGHVFPESDVYKPFANPGIYDSQGNLGPDAQPFATDWADYYQGSIGSGSSDWFGSSPEDFSSNPFATSWADYYPAVSGSGYSDYTAEQESALRGD